VGAGLVGRMMAHALMTQSCRVAIVEKQRPKALDGRLLALSENTCAMLERLNLWTEAVAAGATPIEEIHLRYAGHPASVDWQDKTKPLGFTVPHHLLHNAWPIQKTSFFESSDWDMQSAQNARLITLKDHENKTLESPLIIGCDGIHSQIAEHCGLSGMLRAQPYDAWIFSVGLRKSVIRDAWLRFDHQRTLAFVPATKGGVVILTEHKKTTASIMNTQDEMALLQSRWKESGLQHNLGDLISINRAHRYPVMMRKAKNIYTNRCVLLGHAACALPPLAAQGFNLGVRDVGHFLDTWVDAKAQQLDPGSPLVLEGYRQKRLADHNAMWHITGNMLKRIERRGWISGFLTTFGLSSMQTVLQQLGINSFSKGIGPQSRLASGVPINRWTIP
jgi:2-octaprenyl-6-methoxyphenol hydroxylase